MPQIQLHLIGHNGSGLGQTLVKVAAVPRIGEPLFLHGFTKIKIPELEQAISRFVVKSVELRWDEIDERIIPCVSAQYMERDRDDDSVYRSAEETYGRWPPFG